MVVRRLDVDKGCRGVGRVDADEGCSGIRRVDADEGFRRVGRIDVDFLKNNLMTVQRPAGKTTS